MKARWPASTTGRLPPMGFAAALPVALPLRPLHDTRYADAERLGNGTAALPALNCCNHTLAKIQRIRSNHAGWPPTSPHGESHIRCPVGIPNDSTKDDLALVLLRAHLHLRRLKDGGRFAVSQMKSDMGWFVYL